MSYDSPTKPITKPMLILTSHLTKTPVYYASQEYTAYPDGRVVVYGNKYEVTTSIEAIVKERIEEYLRNGLKEMEQAEKKRIIQ